MTEKCPSAFAEASNFLFCPQPKDGQFTVIEESNIHYEEAGIRELKPINQSSK